MEKERTLSLQDFYIVSDLKSIITNTLSMKFPDVASVQFDKASELALKCCKSNIYDLDPVFLVSELNCSEEFTDAFAKLYRDALFSRAGFLIHAKINQIPTNSFNQWLAYDNVTVPTAPNSATFKTGDPVASEVRKNLNDAFGL